MTAISTTPTTTRWTLDDIAWEKLDRSKVTPDLVAIIKAAAMVERNGRDYGQYLANVFRDDPQFRDAATRWAVEEEQHGHALGRWAALADPAFDMDAAFARFKAMYSIPVDATESVRGSRAAELCARCVVETGTSSLYSAIRDATDEPVLKAICHNIATDEFRHYRLFFDNMERMLSLEGVRRNNWRARWQRLKTAIMRFRETSDDEIATAYYTGNDMAGAYDRAAATAAYSGRVFSLYRERHVRRAAYMFAQAAGFNPDGRLGKWAARILWWIVERRGRAFKAQTA